MFSLTSLPWFRRWFGNRSERAAAKFLQARGCRILARNFRCPVGELDLIALDGDTLVFVEVRSTQQADPLAPALSVNAAKCQRLTQLAVYWLQQKKLLGRAARFDVLAVSWPESAPEPTIIHYPNAFDATGRFQMFS